MKACLILQRRFAYVGQVMAIALREKYGINQFCAYTDLGPSFEFLKSQNDISYTDIFFEPAVRGSYRAEKLDLEYLKKIEGEIGIPNLWAYLEIDRSIRYGQFFREYPHNTPLYTHEEMMRILQVELKAISKFLEKERPDFILFSVITDISTLLFYHLAKKMGIRTLFIQTSRIGTKHSITENYGGLDFVQKTFDNLQCGNLSLPKQKKMAEEFLENFRKHPVPHSQLDTPGARPLSRTKQFQFLWPHKMLNSIYWLIKTGIEYWRYGGREDFVRNPWYFFIDRLKRKLRILRGFEDLYDYPENGEDFAFFPLQFEPEMSLLLFAPFYLDQLWLAKQIGRSLPIHYKLYIKEHPSMFSYRDRKFYKELKKIPNVKLIRPEISSFEITAKAKIIITATSTAAWEGLLLRKPAITFGNTFYNQLPMVKKCEAIAALPHLVKSQLENFNYSEASLINLLTALFKESVDLDLAQIWQIDGAGNIENKKREVALFVDLIAEKLNLNGEK